MHEESTENKHKHRASKNKRAKCKTPKNKYAQALARDTVKQIELVAGARSAKMGQVDHRGGFPVVPIAHSKQNEPSRTSLH